MSTSDDKHILLNFSRFCSRGKSHDDTKRRWRGKRGSLISLSCPHGSANATLSRIRMFAWIIYSLMRSTIRHHRAPFTCLLIHKKFNESRDFD